MDLINTDMWNMKEKKPESSYFLKEYDSSYPTPFFFFFQYMGLKGQLHLASLLGKHKVHIQEMRLG